MECAHIWEKVELINSVYFYCKRCEAEATECYHCHKKVISKEADHGYDVCMKCKQDEYAALFDPIREEEDRIFDEYKHPYVEFEITDDDIFPDVERGRIIDEDYLDRS